jgi:hypothetical protein
MRVAVLLVCVSLVLGCGPAERGEVAAAAPIATQAPAPPDSLGRLDPTPYRARIEATEYLLYSGDSLSEDDWRSLSTAFLELHNAIVFGDSSASARETSAQLFFLSARADATKSSSRDDVELTQIRDLWEKLSDAKFVPTTWIRAQTPAP